MSQGIEWPGFAVFCLACSVHQYHYAIYKSFGIKAEKISVTGEYVFRKEWLEFQNQNQDEETCLGENHLEIHNHFSQYDFLSGRKFTRLPFCKISSFGFSADYLSFRWWDVLLWCAVYKRVVFPTDGSNICKYMIVIISLFVSTRSDYGKLTSRRTMISRWIFLVDNRKICFDRQRFP